MTEGVIKHWNSAHGYGFIACPGADDIFVHVSEVRSSVELKIGQRVQFQIGRSKSGRPESEARAVRIID
jgi:cold shock CspA family protein